MKPNIFLVIVSLLLIVQTSCKKDSSVPVSTPPEQAIADVVLDRPINLTVSKGTFGNKIVMSWTPIPLAKTYQIYKFSEAEQQYKLLQETADTTISDQVSTALVKVFYKVKVYNSAEEYSLFSDVNYGYTSGKNYIKRTSFGSEGTGVTQFQYPMHVETDSENNIYVSDENNYKVEKYNSNGVYQEQFVSGPGPRAIAFLKNGNAITTFTQSAIKYVKVVDRQKAVVAEWGSYGIGEGQFSNIEEITVDDEQNIYIVDGQQNLIKKYDPTGKLLLKFPGAIKTDRQIDSAYPFGVAYLNGKIYVTSPRNSIIRIYDKAGNYLSSFDIGVVSYAIKAKNNYLYIACPGYVLKTDEKAEIREKIGEGDFLTTVVVGVAVNNNEEVIASDVYARKIFVFKRQ